MSGKILTQNLEKLFKPCYHDFAVTKLEKTGHCLYKCDLSVCSESL